MPGKKLLFVAISEEGELDETGIYLPNKMNRKVSEGHIQELPAVLWESFGLVEEAGTGYEYGTEKKEKVTKEVMKVAGREHY